MGIPNIYKYLNVGKFSIMTLLDHPFINIIVTTYFDIKPDIRDKEEKCEQLEIVGRNAFKYLYMKDSPYGVLYKKIEDVIQVCLKHDLFGTISRFQKDFNCNIPENIRSMSESYIIPLLNMDLDTLNAAFDHIKNNYKKEDDCKVEKEKEEDEVKVMKEIHIKNLEPYIKEDHEDKGVSKADQLLLDLFIHLDDLYVSNRKKFSFMIARYCDSLPTEANWAFQSMGNHFKNFTVEELQQAVNYFRAGCESK